MGVGNEPENEYDDDFVARLELVWGEGFLSPGAPEEYANYLKTPI